MVDSITVAAKLKALIRVNTSKPSVRIPLLISGLAIFVLACCSLASSTQPASGGNGESKDLLHPVNPNAPATRPAGLTYSLSDGSANWDPDARRRITEAMDAAVAIYNANGDFHRHVIANFNPGTPTADANFGGWINFGGQIGTRTALHEIAHTMGVGTTPQWQRLAKNGLWTGPYAIQQLKEIDGPDAVLHCDHQHFWPYGLNYDREGGEENFKRHVKMVIALRADMGLGPPPGISAASLEIARTDAAAAHAEVDQDQKALNILPAMLQKARDSQPEVVDAEQKASAAKSAYAAAAANVIKSLETNHDYEAAASSAAQAHQRLDALKASGAGDTSSPELDEAAKAVLASQSDLNKLETSALAADPTALAKKNAYTSALATLTAARTSAKKNDAPQLESAKSALAAATAKAAAADQKVAEIQRALAKEKSGKTQSQAASN